MVMITSVSIDSGSDYKKPTSEVKLASDKTSYERITVELTEKETAEVIKLVSEIIATRLRMPAIKEKLEAAKSVFPPPPATLETSLGTVHFTPDGYKPDKGYSTCDIHHVDYVSDECPLCKEERMPKAADGPDVPF